MSTITLTQGGRTITASEQAAGELRRQGWVIVPEAEPAIAPPVTAIAVPVAAIAVTKPVARRKARK